jgi:hypothetical protein
MEVTIWVLPTGVRSSYLYTRSEIAESRDIRDYYWLAEGPKAPRHPERWTKKRDKPRSERLRRQSSIYFISTFVSNVSTHQDRQRSSCDAQIHFLLLLRFLRGS